MTGALAALIFGLSYGQQYGFTAMASIVALVAAVVLAVGFARAEQKGAAPILSLAILSVPARRAALTAMLLIDAVLAGYVYFVSPYLQRVQGFSPRATGRALTPSTATVVLTSTLVTRRLLTRLTIKQVLLAGLVAMGAGQLWLAQISPDSSYATAVLPGLVLTALGIGLALPAAFIAITSGVQPGDQGLAGALLTSVQQVGAAIGLAILATAAAARTAHAAGSLTTRYAISVSITMFCQSRTQWATWPARAINGHVRVVQLPSRRRWHRRRRSPPCSHRAESAASSVT